MERQQRGGWNKKHGMDLRWENLIENVAKIVGKICKQRNGHADT